MYIRHHNVSQDQLLAHQIGSAVWLNHTFVARGVTDQMARTKTGEYRKLGRG